MSLLLGKPRRFGAVLALLGFVVAAACLTLPVKAAFADDPLLRLQTFGSASALPAKVSCGTPLSNLGRRGDGLTLYSVALDHACRNAAARRIAVAAAAGGVIAILGAIALAGARERRVAA